MHTRIDPVSSHVSSVGTPPQPVSVVFDTGSSSLEFASDECTVCTQTGKFVRAASSTYVAGTRTSTLHFGTGVGVDPVVNDNYVLTVRTGTDTVSVGDVSFPNMSLFTIINQTAPFNIDPFIGIQGMGSRAQGIFAGLVAQGLPCKFLRNLMRSLATRADRPLQHCSACSSLRTLWEMPSSSLGASTRLSSKV